MSDDSGSNASGVILAFLLGGLTGAALAILFAPRSGKETRDLLEERIRESADRGRVVKDRVVGRGREILEEATEYVDKQREGLERRKERVAAAVEAGRQAYRDEIWSGFCPYVSDTERYASVARVISAAEPLDMGRLMFVLAHPAMLRRLWLAVWDSAERPVAFRMWKEFYGWPPYDCHPEDLPEGIEDPYILPFLAPHDPQWETMDTALAWCREMFTGLGLLRAVGG